MTFLRPKKYSWQGTPLLSWWGKVFCLVLIFSYIDTHPWFGLVDHLDALIPNLEDASRPLASLYPTSHLVHSLEKNVLSGFRSFLAQLFESTGVTFCRKIEFETIGPESQQQLEGLRPTLKLFALQLSTIPRLHKYCCISWTNIAISKQTNPLFSKKKREQTFV